ncbi:hypothetical protein GCM10009556_059170 [Acrocarpospora pleiomorpha]
MSPPKTSDGTTDTIMIAGGRQGAVEAFSGRGVELTGRRAPAGKRRPSLVQILAIVAMDRKVAAQPMLSFMIPSRAWIRAQRLETAAGIG